MNVNSILEEMKRRKLKYNEIEFLVNGYVSNQISDEDMTIFLKNVCEKGLSFKETCFLTDIMIKSGETLDLNKVNGVCVDKHSTGGIGDKVSLIVGPIVASLGLKMPKMSGRGLGITGGTIDKLESIPGYKVDIDEKRFIEILNKVGVSIISQSKNLVPADKKIYALRNQTNTVDNASLIASSIMSKKIASSSNVIVIDMKVGKGAFMEDIKSASKLSKMMIKIGKKYNKKVVCILTDMNSPLGKNIGNALEVKEVIDFFEGNKDKRLEEVVTTIAIHLVSLGKNISLNAAKKEVEEVINNGKAKDKFYEWIKEQGGNIKELEINANSIKITSDKEGYVTSIDATIIGEIVKNLGAGRIKKEDSIDYSVGIVLNKTVGDKVNVGDTLCTCYYNKECNIDSLKEAFNIENKKNIDNIVIKICK